MENDDPVESTQRRPIAELVSDLEERLGSDKNLSGEISDSIEVIRAQDFAGTRGAYSDVVAP